MEDDVENLITWEEIKLAKISPRKESGSKTWERQWGIGLRCNDQYSRLCEEADC